MKFCVELIILDGSMKT